MTNRLFTISNIAKYTQLSKQKKEQPLKTAPTYTQVDLEVVLNHHAQTICLAHISVSVFTQTVQILGSNAAVIRKLIEGISEDICTSAILILRVETVITIYIRSRVAARNPKTRRNYTKLACSLPRPHRHSLNLLGILGIGRKIKTTTRQILNIGRDTLTINAITIERKIIANFYMRTRLYTPTKETCILLCAS